MSPAQCRLGVVSAVFVMVEENGVYVKKFLLYLIFCSAVVIAYIAGSFNAIGENITPQPPEQPNELVYRVESYQPSCEQLKQDGRSPWQTVGDDNVVVYTSAKEVYVFGVRFSSQQPPVSYWWRSDRQTALESCRD